MFEASVAIFRWFSLVVYLLFCMRVLSDSYRCKKSGNYLVRFGKSMLVNPQYSVVFALTPVYFYFTIISAQSIYFIERQNFVMVRAENFSIIFQQMIGLPLSAYLALDMLVDVLRRNLRGRDDPVEKKIATSKSIYH